MDNFWVGTFPDWLVGVGTLALAAVTFGGLLRERAEKRRLQEQLQFQRAENGRRELQEVQRAFERERRAQAEQIVVWSDFVKVDEATTYQDINDQTGDGEGAIVQNDSSLPITTVWVHWCNENGPGILESRLIPTVPPRSHRTHIRPVSLSQNPTLPVEIEFIDAHGVLWQRDRDGKVEELK